MQVLATSAFVGRAYVPAFIFLYYAGCVLTGGLLWLVLQWYPAARARLVSRPAQPAEADFFIIAATDGQVEVCPVERIAALPLELQRGRCCGTLGCPLTVNTADISPSERMVVYRHSRFVWSDKAGGFVLQTPEDFAPATNASLGLSKDEAASRANRAGANAIDVPIPSSLALFFREAIHPFFIFQIWRVSWPCSPASSLNQSQLRVAYDWRKRAPLLLLTSLAACDLS